MQIESRITELRNDQSAFKVKAAFQSHTDPAPQRSRRDHAEFDRSRIKHAETVKSAFTSPFESPEKIEPGITADEIQAEIDRLKAKAAETTESAFKPAETPESAAKPAENPEGAAKPADSKAAEAAGAAEALREQIKAVSELLTNKGLSKPVTNQLEKIYTLLCKQEKTDPDNISEELQNEIDKLSEMLSPKNEEKKKSLAEMLEEQKERIENLFSDLPKNDNSVGIIKNKIRQGRKLTPSEQQMLSAKDPAAYESYRRLDAARSMFRCSLNNCRTRDDVIGMRLSNALTALSSYKKAIREGGDGNDVAALNAAFENEIREFAGSSAYRKLPTAAECNKFDRDIAKARRYEREKRLEKRREQLRSKKYKKKTKKTPGDGKRTVAQVLADPTSKKVLASRAKRTYCSCRKVLLDYRMNSKA